MASIIKADTLQSTTSNVFILNSVGTEYARFDSTGIFQLANPITFLAGTQSLPYITTVGDTNTGIFFPAADTIAFTEGGVESMRMDSGGNVGIGTSSVTGKLNVSGAAAGISAYFTDAINSSLAIRNAAGGVVLGTDAGGVLRFATNGNATTDEKMRIDSSGNVGIGTTNIPSNKDTVTPKFIVNGAGGAGSMQVVRNTTVGAGGAILELTATRGSDVNSYTILQSGDGIGSVIFGGADGNEFVQAASIVGAVDGTPGDNDMPGRLVFSTTADGASSTTERMRIDSSGNVGIGTSSPVTKLVLAADNSGLVENNTLRFWDTDTVTEANQQLGKIEFFSSDASGFGASVKAYIGAFATDVSPEAYLAFATEVSSGTPTERVRIDASGNFLVGQSSTITPGSGNATAGATISSGGRGFFSVSGSFSVFNRSTDDGGVIGINQDGTQEGIISVSGTTVSYTGGHLSRWAQTTTAKDESLVKGTVLSNLDAMNVYTDADGNPVDNEQLNKIKVSDVEGDANVAGVFVNWTHDDQHDVDEINMAMTGDMIIRIAQGTTVARGDLLMSAGDGTAKPQGDDIVRSKTIAKVTSTHVTCTYADGSFCVPCVLMAC